MIPSHRLKERPSGCTSTSLAVQSVSVALLAASNALQSAYLPILAFAVQYLGLMAERWYFFAEARHPQNLYYQSIA